MKILRIPLRRADALQLLDPDDAIDGYVNGYKNQNPPTDASSYSYWHFWRGGMVDGGHRAMDDAQKEMRKDMEIKNQCFNLHYAAEESAQASLFSGGFDAA
jgi:hypothetical protein